jgi:hypothetical protein
VIPPPITAIEGEFFAVQDCEMKEDSEAAIELSVGS